MPASLNSIHLAGNLTKEVELKYTPSGTAVATLAIAINEARKMPNGTYKEVVTYVDIEAWSRTAENCKEYLTKGSPVLIEGKLKQEQWEQDGQKRSRLKVVADRVQFLDSRQPRATQNAPQLNPEPKQAIPATVPAPDDDDVPF